MKTLPYFKWYPADAEMDVKYSSLNDQELGFYHRCINRSWANGGLPADLDELAKAMHVTREYVDAVWPMVGRCFEKRNCVLICPRQEVEREAAITKSKHMKRPKNRSANKTEEIGQNAIATQLHRNCDIRAYESVSVSDSSSLKGGAGGEPAWKRDEQFARFAADYLSTGASLIDADFAEAWQFCWRTLDFEQKLTRMAGLASHAAEYAENPRFVPKPLKFLQTEWERPVRPPPAGTGQMTGADRVKALAMKNLATRGRIL